jgi:hypothetical protein
VLALGYYDGPTDGLLWEDQAGRAYRFEMLAWDDRQDLRVFRLRELPASAFAQLVDRLSRCEPPRWPLWVPSWRAEMEPPTEEALRQAGPSVWVIAAEDLLGEIVAAKPAPTSAAVDADWFSFLGLVRDGAGGA